MNNLEKAFRQGYMDEMEKIAEEEGEKETRGQKFKRYVKRGLRGAAKGAVIDAAASGGLGYALGGLRDHGMRGATDSDLAAMGLPERKDWTSRRGIAARSAGKGAIEGGVLGGGVALLHEALTGRSKKREALIRAQRQAKRAQSQS